MTGIIDTEHSHLMTDGHPAYRLIRHKMPHNVVRHEVTYVDGDVHIQGIEGYCASLKRGLIGTFHSTSMSLSTDSTAGRFPTPSGSLP